MTNEQAKQVFKPVLIALTIVGAFLLMAIGSMLKTEVTIDAIVKRDIICANQEYNPQTAKLDIDVCRKSFKD
ncbi:hypothetical protein KVY46_002884 [Escherichia coli]|nr:hypothetical protein [Escherichia coli]